MRTIKNKILNKKGPLNERILLWCLKLKIEDEQKYTILDNGSNSIYYFEDYNSFLEYFTKFGINVNFYKKSIDKAKLFCNKNGGIYAPKYLCDYVIYTIQNFPDTEEKKNVKKLQKQ